MNESTDSDTLYTNKELNQKIFYIPDITQKDLSAGKLKVLEYIQPDNIAVEGYYASKVIPGQSLRQALMRDLSQDFGYKGKVQIEPEAILIDKATDKSGKEIPRYEVTLSLLDEFDIDSAKPLGCDLKWSEYELEQSDKYLERALNQQTSTKSTHSQNTVAQQHNNNDERKPRQCKELTSEDLNNLKKVLQVQDLVILDNELITIETIDYKPSISVSSDWKWNDESVFSQIKEVVPEASIKYDHESDFGGDIHEAGFGNFEDYTQSLQETWHLTFEAFGEKNSLSLERLDINALFDLINSLIEPRLNKKFINLETFGDFNLFLLAPADIDLGRFNKIIYKY